uniref:Uncharacterized protein n=1 Tax=Agrobacterium tumefaciens TaxID=358 RepID=A0A5B9T6Q8_AGRTU|nr:MULTISPECIES: hypothetical protein [Agrobacterium tumefaciens complex]QEG96983.1 hypothetical protein AgrTiSule1_00060 [Agrobacterium tumefaciens]QEG97185.1 hypothetical protein AgrTiCFBP2178_00060 [Agrobacterium tumefaciens]QEG97387.1 hypothetical protein AgrTiCFBP1935_00060 [Agrobacterium tumefaciens]QEG97808.1 hypothetical protein AgrTiKerr27_00078 [Agrobacterium tumefaciens]
MLAPGPAHVPILQTSASRRCDVSWFWGDDFIVLPPFMRANGALFLEHVMPIL